MLSIQKPKRFRQPRSKEQKQLDNSKHAQKRLNGHRYQKSAEQKAKYAAARKEKLAAIRKEKTGSVQDAAKDSTDYSPAEQADVLLPLEVDELESDSTAWLDHLVEDPVLADDRNEAPNMYGISKI